jgi:N-acetylmuramoyl-L-alanine amidase
MNISYPELKYDKPLIKLDLSKVKYMILHHIGKEFATSQDIHKWHKERGWNGAGYNEYIKKDGSVEILRGDHIGAQCEGMNSKSYGLALEGDYDKEMVMPEKQFNSLLTRIKENKKRFPNFVSVENHATFVNTDCPGKYFPLDKIIISLENPLAADLLILTKNKIVSSPEYWLSRLSSNQPVDNTYVTKLINNIATYIKGR